MASFLEALASQPPPQQSPFLAALASAPPPPPPAKSAPSEGAIGWAKDLGSALVRPVAKAAAALPLMAMDAGVASRNLLERGYQKVTGKQETPYAELPSAMFNRALDTYTRPPEGIGKGAEFVSSLLLGSRLPMPASDTPVPENFAPPKTLLRNQVLNNAGKAAYVVPPSTANPTLMNRLLEGISGKLKLQQEAALRNQGVTDRLMTESVGESPESPITQGALETIRTNAAKEGYEPIRGIGQIATDDKYGRALDAIDKAAQPGKLLSAVRPNSEVSDLVSSLKQPTIESSDAVDTIQYLRQSADDAFRAGKAAVGRAYKGAAKALEDQIQRHLEAQPNPQAKQMLASFRNARTLIAKTYTAGKALTESGNFNARSVANELGRNKPLTGGQRVVGQFASVFPRAARLTQESFPAISPLDAYGSAIAGAAAHSVAPLALPLTRVGIREYLLSPAGQARALQALRSQPKTIGLLPSSILQSGLLSSPSTAP